MRRRAGVLVHPSSLPGAYGIGDLGPATRELLAWMDSAALRVWQVLPLTPVDPLGSPYASESAFAIEPLLLSIDDLVTDGWLLAREKPYAKGRATVVDWPEVAAHKGAALQMAADRVAAATDLQAFAAQRPQVATYALGRALAREQGGPWPTWSAALRDRDPNALGAATDRLQTEIASTLALQWLAEEQWRRVRAQATAAGIEIWGDVPYLVHGDAADVWAQPDLWRLGDDRRPQVVSGVPPDAFSPTGQVWGHPLFDEEAHRAEGYAWWLARMARALEMADRVRIDHFRGIQALWEVPAGAEDATSGTWVPGPGRGLLEALASRWPDLPFLAEDLGVITAEVEALRRDFGLPGMVILQFAFGTDGSHPYLPHNHEHTSVCYTGTHDNDTTLGWYLSNNPEIRDHVRRYLSCADRDLPWTLVQAGLRSVCDATIVPLQDLLGLGGEARMNHPGTVTGNWSWRAGVGAFSLVLAERIAREVRLSGRDTARQEQSP